MPSYFEYIFHNYQLRMLEAPTVDVGTVHAQDISNKPEWVTREIMFTEFAFQVPHLAHNLQEMIKPNLPWAEDHFQERVSGEPLNPPPSHEYWPYAREGNAEHLIQGKFSHTYPERFWPSYDKDIDIFRWGIRFRYGDLNDLVKVLNENPFSRQAYLPIWFPEDLAAVDDGNRVPCSLGYHFLIRPDMNGNLVLNCQYFMRSCDLMRYFRDDAYLAGRLMQWVVQGLDMAPLTTGILKVHISSLHCFEGDLPIIRHQLKL